MPTAVSGGNGTLLCFTPGADCQFAQTWNLYGRGIVDMSWRDVRRTREMEERDKRGALPLVYGRSVIMTDLPLLREMWVWIRIIGTERLCTQLSLVRNEEWFNSLGPLSRGYSTAPNCDSRRLFNITAALPYVPPFTQLVQQMTGKYVHDPSHEQFVDHLHPIETRPKMTNRIPSILNPTYRASAF